MNKNMIKRSRNRTYKTLYKTAMKTCLDEMNVTNLSNAQSVIAKAHSKGSIHKNKKNRLISTLAKKYNNLK